jgi:hypothetical protein
MKFVDALAQLDQMSYTDNGALTLSTSGSKLVDLFFLFGASRGKNLTESFKAAYEENPILTSKLALWGRDIRGGAGERELFLQYLRWLSTYDPVCVEQIITSGLIHEVGRFKDYLVFAEPDMYDLYENKLFKLAAGQIANGLSDPNRVGLASKWMPVQGRVAMLLARQFGMSPRNWRKRIVSGRNVVEQQMCAKEWAQIKFEQVPSLAMTRYLKAFKKHTPDTLEVYKASLVKGETKVNAAAIYPYDIVRGLYSGGDKVVLEKQWEALPDYMNGRKVLPIVDVSGSMGTKIAGQISAMDVAVSIGLYIATKQKNDFNNVVMSFSSESEIIKLKTKNLLDQIREVMGIHWGMSTNLQAAFNNLLQFGKKFKVSQEEMPETILIISDMEFDSCAGGSSVFSKNYSTNFDEIETKYAESGYTRPNIVFWNVNGRVGNSPVSFKQNGTALVSGFSPSIMKSILAGENLTPESIMLNTINIERYDFLNKN